MLMISCLASPIRPSSKPTEELGAVAVSMGLREITARKPGKIQRRSFNIGKKRATGTMHVWQPLAYG